MENLTQAEREMLYALRKFTLYRKSFSVQIATDYYHVLRNRDMALNNWNGYQSAKKNAERTRPSSTKAAPAWASSAGSNNRNSLRRPNGSTPFANTR
jgi:hypothetical protein